MRAWAGTVLLTVFLAVRPPVTDGVQRLIKTNCRAVLGQQDVPWSEVAMQPHLWRLDLDGRELGQGSLDLVRQREADGLQVLGLHREDLLRKFPEVDGPRRERFKRVDLADEPSDGGKPLSSVSGRRTLP